MKLHQCTFHDAGPIGVLADRKEVSLETWVDDAGDLRHLTLVQKPGQPFEVYFDGVRCDLTPRVGA